MLITNSWRKKSNLSHYVPCRSYESKISSTPTPTRDERPHFVSPVLPASPTRGPPDDAIRPRSAVREHNQHKRACPLPLDPLRSPSGTWISPRN
eukprot:176044-Prorocentrum_minimum.AAC.1